MTFASLPRRFDVRLAGVLVFGASYFLLSRLGLSLVSEVDGAAVIWPASGLALGVFVLSPRRWWPALVGAIFASALIAQFLARGLHPTGAALAAVNAIEPVIAAALMLLVLGRGGETTFGSKRGVVGLLAAVTLSNGATAILGGLVLSVGVGAPLISAASTWWTADGLGMLAVAPVVFGMARSWGGRFPGIEEICLILATTVTTAAVFFPTVWSLSPQFRHAYFVLMILAWTAVRSTPRTTSIATLIVALGGTAGTLAGGGPFAASGPASLERLEDLQSFLGASALLALVLGGVLAERRALEARLAAGRERFSSVLRAATEFSVIGTDLNGTITVFNEGAERMLGYEAREMIDRLTPAVIHDPIEVSARAAELGIAPGFDVFVHALRERESETREWTYIRSDRTRIRVSLTVTAMWDAGGNLVGYIGIGRDVTESARADAERSALERVSRAVAGNEDLDAILSLVAREAGQLHGAGSALITRFDTGEVGTVIGAWTEEGWLSSLQVDLDGETAPALVRRTGAVGRTHVSADPGGLPPEVLEEGGLCAGVAAPVVVGGRVWGTIGIEAGTHRFFAQDPSESLGRLAALVGLAVTNANYRTALVRRGDELSAIMDGLPGMVWVWSRSGHLMLANRAYRDFTTVDPLTGGQKDGAFDSADEALHIEAMASGDVTYSEQSIVTASGEERRLLVARSPLVDRWGEVYALCCTATDITERHEMERAKDEFVSVVSHELRTPLSSIRGALALLVDDTDELPPGAQRRMIEIALENTKRLVALINDILDLQRIASGSAVVDLRKCDGGELVVKAAEAMGPAALESGVQITVAGAEAPLRADPDRILQVLNNLLGNAVKFTPSGGLITIGTTQVGDEIRFFVRDDGRGIPADKLETIFGRFEQVDSSDSRRVGGTGLGLAICREIAEQHEGRIWAESELGHGSCFWVAVPAATAADDHLDEPDAPAGTVLICDDDPGARANSRAVVEGLGLTVLEASSGRAAVRLAEAAQPTAILLDLVMPGMDGFDTLKALSSAEKTADIPVIVVSALSADVEDAPAPVLDWVTKPFPAERLAQAVAVAVRLSGPRRVLVVEDDESLADVLIEGLRRNGLMAIHARTGREGIDLVVSIRPDLVILDVGLPEGDGFAVVEALRERQIAPALVVYSALDLDARDRERLTLGATEFVTKGRVSPEEFQERVAELADQIRSQQP